MFSRVKMFSVISVVVLNFVFIQNIFAQDSAYTRIAQLYATGVSANLKDFHDYDAFPAKVVNPRNQNYVNDRTFAMVLVRGDDIVGKRVYFGYGSVQGATGGIIETNPEMLRQPFADFNYFVDRGWYTKLKPTEDNSLKSQVYYNGLVEDHFFRVNVVDDVQYLIMKSYNYRSRDVFYMYLKFPRSVAKLSHQAGPSLLDQGHSTFSAFELTDIFTQ